MKSITKTQLKKLVESVVSEQLDPTGKSVKALIEAHSQALIEDLYKEAEKLYDEADRFTDESVVLPYLRKGDYIVDHIIPKIIGTLEELRASVDRGL